jgi:hypothetical protein
VRHPSLFFVKDAALIFPSTRVGQRFVVYDFEDGIKFCNFQQARILARIFEIFSLPPCSELTSMEYKIAEVADRNAGIVAKICKSTVVLPLRSLELRCSTWCLARPVRAPAALHSGRLRSRRRDLDSYRHVSCFSSRTAFQGLFFVGGAEAEPGSEIP